MATQKANILFVTLLITFVLTNVTIARQPVKQDNIISGVPWFDNKGNVLSAHGANIVKDNNRFYLFGEYKSDTSNAFNGFSCYSSTDFINWKFERMALPATFDGKPGFNRVGERPKVMRCPKTGEYILFMHVDNLGYKDPYVGYATSKKINGEYQFQGALLFENKPIKKWDIGVFQDNDGCGYLITHSGNLFKLSDDYKSVTEQVVNGMTPQCEAPVIFRKDSLYFWLGSHLTSWERNDNYYFTATALKGPWTERGLIAPEGTLTWNSQATSVLAVTGKASTTFLYMGDRWAFPRQKSSATYVWQPLSIKGFTLSMTNFEQSWKIDPKTGSHSISPFTGITVFPSDTSKTAYTGKWRFQPSSAGNPAFRSNEKNASISIPFYGTQIALYGIAAPENGYATIHIQNSKRETLLESTIDMYSKYTEESLKFVSPVLKKGHYKLTVSVTGDRGNWFDKRGTVYGSTDNYVSVSKFVVKGY